LDKERAGSRGLRYPAAGGLTPVFCPHCLCHAVDCPIKASENRRRTLERRWGKQARTDRTEESCRLSLVIRKRIMLIGLGCGGSLVANVD